MSRIACFLGWNWVGPYPYLSLTWKLFLSLGPGFKAWFFFFGKPKLKPDLGQGPCSAWTLLGQPTTLISVVPTTIVATSLGPPGLCGAPQEPRPWPLVSTAPAFSTFSDPLTHHQSLEETSPQPPIFTTLAAFAFFSFTMISATPAAAAVALLGHPGRLGPP